MIKNKFILIDQDSISKVTTAMETRDLDGYSETVQEYESNLKKYFSSKFAITAANGTMGIELGLRAAGISVGDEVLVPATAPVMTALPILGLGAIPVFYDTKGSDTFEVSIPDLESKKTKKTKAVITVPMWGYPINIKEVLDFSKKHNLFLLEDCSQAHGSRSEDQYLGTFGDIGLFSTHERKMVATGEGAFLLTQDIEINEKLGKLRFYGVGFASQKKSFGEDFGLNYKLNTMAAALGIDQLTKLDNRIRTRTKNAKFILKNIIEKVELHEFIYRGVPNYYSLAIWHSQAIDLNNWLESCEISSDVVRYGYRCLYDYSVFEKYKSECPNAEKLVQEIVIVPVHEGLSQNDLDIICSSILSFQK